MKFSWNCLAAVVLGMITTATLHAETPADAGQHAQKFEKQITVTLDYLLFLPEDYAKDADKKWPLILFLHGSGERGNDINKVKVHGIPKIVEDKKDFGFITISPQCPDNGWWKANELELLLDDVVAKYHVDADRVYLTGLSMGGFGTWDLAIDAPKRFAAIAPMCGGGNPYMARRLKDIPIWVFHGDADKAVPVQKSDEMVDALKKAGADVKFTRYEGVGHDCWTQSYDNPELYTWFLSHKRGEKRATTNPATAPAK